MRSDALTRGRMPGAYMYASALNTPLGTSSTIVVPLNTMFFDTHGFCDLVNNRLAIPVGMNGWYRVTGQTNITSDAAQGGYGVRWQSLQMNDSGHIINQQQEPPPWGAVEWCETLSGIAYMMQGDSVKLRTWQNSGYALQVRGGYREFTWMSIEFLGKRR